MVTNTEFAQAKAGLIWVLFVAIAIWLNIFGGA